MFASLALLIHCAKLYDVHDCSGMPECKLGLNDRVLLEAQGRTTKGKAIDLDDIKFHQYVASCHNLRLYSNLIVLFTFLWSIACVHTVVS